jgi:predicted membrane-bound spermidine synthase
VSTLSLGCEEAPALKTGSVIVLDIGSTLERAGALAGLIAALSTLGAILGTFLTVLVLLPSIGVTRTTYLIATSLMLLAIVGLRDWRYLPLLALVAALAWGTMLPFGVASYR